jgi:hypothetical protein
MYMVAGTRELAAEDDLPVSLRGPLMTVPKGTEVLARDSRSEQTCLIGSACV